MERVEKYDCSSLATCDSKRSFKLRPCAKWQASYPYQNQLTSLWVTTGSHLLVKVSLASHTPEIEGCGLRDYLLASRQLVVSWEHKISPRDMDVQHIKWGSSNFPAASGVGEWGEISPSALEITPSVIWFHVETNHTPNGGVNVALRCTEAGA